MIISFTIYKIVIKLTAYNNYKLKIKLREGKESRPRSYLTLLQWISSRLCHIEGIRTFIIYEIPGRQSQKKRNESYKAYAYFKQL